MEIRNLLLFVAYHHKHGVQQLITFGHPIHKYCMFENALLWSNAEDVRVVSEVNAEDHNTVRAQSSADDVVHHEGAAEVQGAEEFHESRGRDAHDEVDGEYGSAATREERVEDAVVDIPHCRE